MRPASLVTTPPSRNRGFALLIVLWMLVPLSALFLTLSGAARSDSQLAFNLRKAASLTAAADAGIETALFALLQPGGSAAPLRLSLGAPTVTIAVSVEIEDLSGLVNPNTAQPSLLRALLIRTGTDPARADRLASAIVDWRTPAQGRRPNGAKAEAYRAAGLDYGPPGEPIESLDELLLVLGMTQPTYQALLPNLTLATDRPPDPALAPPAVRAALGDLGIAARPGPAQRGPTSGEAFRIVAKADDATGAQIVRAATIKLGAGDQGRPWRVLDWNTSP